MIVFLYYYIGMFLFNGVHFLFRHQRFEKAFLLAVDLEARDLFMVSGNYSKFKLNCFLEKNIQYFVRKVHGSHIDKKWFCSI